ncbi:Cupin domain-containing protein [Campylobacter iguaniorum]|uniref:cupin domain-containing protein n=1 Tax=Campylobacter iguaniorum TaxID=1244531 RepID=UPI00073A08E8|nr:cupin domain-containing protein [Campylobacter iguaniorum]ALV24329.1 Cupin domain-containing protein [Campylobacter iguaniorum]
MEKITFSNTTFDGVKPAKLLETSFSKEIRISMQKGSFMDKHKAPGDIIVHVLSGAIIFDVSGHETQLNAFDMISLDANIEHSLRALEDSIIRLSLSKIDKTSRVFSVNIGVKAD